MLNREEITELAKTMSSREIAEHLGVSLSKVQKACNAWGIHCQQRSPFQEMRKRLDAVWDDVVRLNQVEFWTSTEIAVKYECSSCFIETLALEKGLKLNGMKECRRGRDRGPVCVRCECIISESGLPREGIPEKPGFCLYCIQDAINEVREEEGLHQVLPTARTLRRWPEFKEAIKRLRPAKEPAKEQTDDARGTDSGATDSPIRKAPRHQRGLGLHSSVAAKRLERESAISASLVSANT